MATLNKKLKIKSGSSTQSCNLYTTTTEAGSDNLKLKVDNQNVYASLTTTSDSKASKGRIKKSNATKAIAISGKPPYTEKSWTTAGTYTFTVPSGITRIRVAVCGGGGGGAIANDTRNSSSTSASGTAGENSKFDNIIATGGGGGYTEVEYYRGGYSKSGYYYSTDYNGHVGSAGSPNGHAGIRTTSTGTFSYDNMWGRSVSFTDTTKENNNQYGSGGGGGNNSSSDIPSEFCSGGSGGFSSQYINVTSGKTYTIVVGKGGNRGNNSSVGNAKNGKQGFVLIAYGGDI